MPGEDARTHLAHQWLTKADHDLRAAVLASGADDALWDIAAFHSQQAAEKSLKAFLTWQDFRFRRTHDLIELVQECEAIDAAFVALRTAAQFLTQFAVDVRYPGAESDPGAEAAGEALQRAREVMNFVLERLPGEPGPDTTDTPVPEAEEPEFRSPEGAE
jgi:HEPN domain-containing protein